MMRLRQHQDGYLLESAPFGTDYFWRPKQPPLGVGATAYVARYLSKLLAVQCVEADDQTLCFDADAGSSWKTN